MCLGWVVNGLDSMFDSKQGRGSMLFVLFTEVYVQLVFQSCEDLKDDPKCGGNTVGSARYK